MSSLREELAKLMHEIWAGWMNHVFLHCTQERIEGQGSEIVIPGSLVYRWSRQIDTPYDKLSESEKDSDRIEADKVLAVIEKAQAISCRWEPAEEIYEEYWKTSCGEAFVFTDGGPVENNARFCLYCGKRIAVLEAIEVEGHE